MFDWFWRPWTRKCDQRSDSREQQEVTMLNLENRYVHDLYLIHVKVNYLVYSFHNKLIFRVSYYRKLAKEEITEWDLRVKLSCCKIEMVIQDPISDLLYSFCPMEQNWVYLIWHRVALGRTVRLRFQHCSFHWQTSGVCI